jgi:hypothetical protein
LQKLFEELKGEPYSFNSVEKILEEIDLKFQLDEQFESISATVVKI